jgi:hypothetical protein
MLLSQINHFIRLLPARRRALTLIWCAAGGWNQVWSVPMWEIRYA